LEAAQLCQLPRQPNLSARHTQNNSSRLRRRARRNCDRRSVAPRSLNYSVDPQTKLFTPGM
ncbi:MAG TPA: hypothetical protein VEV81_05350, partial [Pyrinomonadaceae bacterium]|nr:hypothetical protein [Pyrinomonadaceae bacterium]